MSKGCALEEIYLTYVLLDKKKLYHHLARKKQKAIFSKKMNVIPTEETQQHDFSPNDQQLRALLRLRKEIFTLNTSILNCLPRTSLQILKIMTFFPISSKIDKKFVRILLSDLIHKNSMSELSDPYLVNTQLLKKGEIPTKKKKFNLSSQEERQLFDDTG